MNKILFFLGPFGGRYFWLALSAVLIQSQMLLHVAGFNPLVVLAITLAVGWWLGVLAGRADWEARQESFLQRYEYWKAQYDWGVEP